MRAPDQDRRDTIVAARGINLSVEAGAGTGKTTLLVSRVLARLEDGVPLPRLAVITFTRKAAAELVARIRVKLGERRERDAWAARAIDDFDRASIGTTDSFCRSILSDFPLEAGVPPGFALADEVAQAALRDEAWRRRLERADDDGRRLLARLRESGVSTERLRAVADDLLSNRDLEVARIETPGPPDLVATFGERLERALALRGLCEDPGDGLLSHLAELEHDLRLARALDGAAAERAVLRRAREKKRYAPAAKGSGSGRAASWGGKENKERVLAELSEVQAVVDDFLARRSRRLAADVAGWIARYVATYGEAKRERGLLDFRDLALATRNLLRSDGRVRRLVASRYDEILMDEVQDTDPLQMEIAFLLAGVESSAAARDGADAGDPLATELVPGRLFLVGDPKQSIYRFRRADIELYERARRRFAERGGAQDIVANFRSHPDLVAFVNLVFEGWLERGDGATGQARWTALVPGRPVDSGGAAPGAAGRADPRVSLLLGDPAVERTLLERTGAKKPGAAVRSEVEIDAVARAVRRLLGLDGGEAIRVPDGTGAERPARPADVAVLVRKIAWGDRLLENLRRVGVPATVAGGKRFHVKEEIRTLLAVLEPLVEPDDALARFAALRSPVFGLPDDDLVLRFLEEDDPEDPRAAAVADALARLDALRAEARVRPVPELLELVVSELAILPVFGFRPDGRSRVESLRILLEAADSLVDAGFDSLPAFVRWLREEAREERGEAPGEGDPGAGGGVQILTMHKSKGLEFPIVVLADLGSGTPGDRRFVGDHATGRIEFRLSAAERIQTPGYEEAAGRERIRQSAEEVRLLYVAMTRARERLVLSWPPADRGFLASPAGEPSLPERIGAAPGDSPPEAPGAAELGLLRAGELPPLAGDARVHRVDPDRLPAPAAPPPDDWIAASRRARGGPRIRPATTLGEDRPEADPTGSPAAPEAASANRMSFHGKEFGTLVHAFFERHDPAGALDPESELRRAAARLGPGIADALSPEDLGEIAAWLSGRLRDPEVEAVFDRIRAGGEAYREVPFLARAGTEVISGSFDVLLAEPDGSLRVLDWKTDRDAARAGDAARERHRSQALVYAWAAHRLTGRPIREVRFLFLAASPVVSGSFPGDEAFLREAEAFVERAVGAL